MSRRLSIGRAVLAVALTAAGLAAAATGSSAQSDTPPGIAAIAATDGIAPGNAIDIDLTPNGLGYWVTLSDGTVLSQNAPLFGDRPELDDGESVAALAPSRSGQGYWLFTTTGRAFAYGDANHYGDMITTLPPGVSLNGAIYDAIPTASGRGYYMLGDDGGIFAFGDAEFFGSIPGLFAPGGPAEGGRLAAPVVGISPTPTGQGYWLVAEDGGTFAFGDADFVGSVPGLFLPTGPNPGGALNAPVIGMIGQGDGYLLLGADGGIFNFGQSIFHGSLGGLDVPAPIVNVAALEDQSGYVMVDTDGRVYGFGDVRPLIAPRMFATRPPQDVMLDPEVAEIGQSITLTAGHLGLVEGQVTIDGADTALTYWAGTPDDTPGTVVFPVPEGLANGFHEVAVSNRIGAGAPTRGLVVVGGPDDSGIELRISSAAAVSNTEVVVQFNKAVDPRTAELPASYRIGASDIPDAAGGAAVRVTSAEVIRPSLTTVRLTTLPQSETDYSLSAVDLVDLAGAPLAPTGPSTAEFRGVGPNTDGQVDSDDDGITDADEQRGWLVSVRTADGAVTRRVVTSDPELADTDGDGVTDLEERHAASDPRSPDTDGDRLSDGDEWNVVLSSPVDQDTDGDGSQDGLEFYVYRTSPLTADTDGDQISDTDEVLSRSRDPRVADLPAHVITVGDVRLQLDQRFTYQDNTGRTVSTTDTTDSTLTNTTRNERTTGGSLTFKGGLEVETGFEGLTFSFKVKPSFEVTSTSQWSDTSARETQRAFQQTTARALERSSTNSVTREVVGARVDADVTIENEGDVAFEIKSLEITVSEREPGSTRLAPVATLIANSSLMTGEDTTFTLGPFDRTRGPILFSSKDVFPNLVERLMADPTSLAFNVANYEVIDEFGRSFSFSDQVTRDRTGGILIDAGDGQVQRHLVATSLQRDSGGVTDDEVVGGFNPDGSPVGLPLDFVLQDILGLSKNATTPDGIVSTDQTASTRARGDDIQLIPTGTTGVPVGSVIVAAGPNGVLDSSAQGSDVPAVTTGYETQMIDGVETLVRLGSQRNGDLNRQWVVLSTGEAPASADFGELLLDGGEDFYFVFVQDLDEDGLFSRTEFLAGSTDSLADRLDNASFGQVARDPVDGTYPLVGLVETPDGVADSKDTDRDGLGDFAELQVGWTVSAPDGSLVRTFSSPRLADSDGDGLLDPQEQDLRRFCADPDDPRRDALCTFLDAPRVDQDAAIAIIAGANGVADTQATGDDVQVVSQGRSGLTYAARIISPGANGVIDSSLSGDDEYESTASSLRVPPATSPISIDSDGDGVSDFDELVGFRVGVAIRDGGTACDTCRGVAESQAIGDDVQVARVGGPVAAGGIVVLPGPNGTIESAVAGDDVESAGAEVTTDPLRQDTDSDLVADGEERDVGSDPTNPDDAAQFRDADQDGLTDAEESILGWFVDIDSPLGAPPCEAPSPTCRFVLSNPSRPDSDNDGLPDLAERLIRTDPNRADTDGDGLTDFDELADFTQFRGLEVGNPGFVLDSAASRQFGSDPTRADSDLDGLTDRAELVTGYYLLVADEAQPRWIRTNPTQADTDLDGVSDFDERNRTPAATDATDPDTDDDGRNDGIERQTGTDPRRPDVSVTVRFGTLAIDKIDNDFLCQVFNRCGLGFFYTVTPPGAPRQLTATANNAPNAVVVSTNPFFPACRSLLLQRDRGYTYPLVNASTTFTLRPGESFQVDGIIFDHDFLNIPSTDCGLPPHYIPTSVGSGCVTRFSQVFEFEDFDTGGQANFPFPDGSDTEDQCDWEQQVYVSSR